MRYRVESFEVESDEEWVLADGSYSHAAEKIKRLTGVTGMGDYEIWIPATVQVELLPEPVKVGDVIESLAGLNVLKSRTVVVDKDGDSWQKHGDKWFMAGKSDSNQLRGYMPATVVYVP
jgi:hypothetical protein